MAVIITANVGDVVEMAKALNRYEQLGGYYGLKALFHYYDELSEDCGEDMELDIVAWCCEWNTYDNLNQFFTDYSGYDEAVIDMDDDEKEEFISELTQVIPFQGGYHVFQF